MCIRDSPRRGALLLAFAAVVLAGAFGAFIGFGLADLSTSSTTTMGNLIGALIGAVIGAGGVGIVAVLALRAMAEWNTHPATSDVDAEAAPPMEAADPDDLDAASDR